MLRRPLVLVVVALALVGASCSKGDEDAEPGSTSTAISPGATEAGGTTVITTDTTQTTESDSSSSSSSSQVSIPPVTPPPGQPAACSLLSDSALEAVGVAVGTAGAASDQPDGVPAPSTGCRWESDVDVAVALYYGRDPLEILAIARQISPGGVDVVGIGQDAYYVTGVLFVDTGSQAFAITGGPTQEQLQALAQNVLTNL